VTIEIAPLTRDEVARRSGVDEQFVDRLVELGIVTSSEAGFTEGDVRRTRIMHALDAAGMPLEAVGIAIRQGQIDLSFVEDPAYALFAGPTEQTFADVSADTGIPLELLLTVREAMGSAQPAAGDRMRALELEVVPAVRLQLANGVRAEVIERMLRAYGDNLRRMSEVEADWWMSDVIQPVLARGGQADVGPQTADFANAFGPVGDRMVLALFHGHQSQAWLKNFFEGFEATLARAGLHSPNGRQPAICFLDLSGYTRLTEERGDEAAAELAGRLSRLVQRTSARYGGKAVKWLGDGVMFYFRDPGQGVLAALDMIDGAAEDGLPPAHVGLHAGPVLFQEGDYFGRTVNVAARIADYARRGEVLVSDDVVGAAQEEPGVRFDAIGPVELKGMTEAIPLNVARRVGQDAPTR